MLRTANLVVTTLVFAGGFSALEARRAVAARASEEPQPVSAVIRRAQQELLDQHLIEQSAALTGSLKQVLPRPDSRVGSLSSLVQDSSEIIVGTVSEMSSSVAGDSSKIMTEAGLLVESSWKGDAPIGAIVHLLMPGGKVQFPNKSWAETSIVNLPGLQLGRRYVAFLKKTDAPVPSRFLRSPEPFPIFQPVHLAAGLFDVVAPDLIRPRPGARPALGFSVDGLTEADFRRQVFESLKTFESGGR